MNLRMVSALLAIALAAADALAADPPRVGFLGMDSRMQSPRLAAFADELHKLGFVEGKNIVIETRFAEGRFDRLDGLAADLVASDIQVLVTAAPQAIRAAQRATRTVPIVMSVHDPVALGLVDSLRQPGGNITGIAFQDSDLSTKRLDLLRQAVPRLARVAVLWDANAAAPETIDKLETLAKAKGMQTLAIKVTSPADFAPALAEAKKWGAQAVLQMPAPMMTLNRRALIDLINAQRLPASCEMRWYVDDGCLMTYSADLNQLFRAMAQYVVKILNGAKPAEMAIGQPREFELVINQRTAESLGLTLPSSLMVQATDVIR